MDPQVQAELSELRSRLEVLEHNERMRANATAPATSEGVAQGQRYDPSRYSGEEVNNYLAETRAPSRNLPTVRPTVASSAK
jgi:hypothetical protein